MNDVYVDNGVWCIDLDNGTVCMESKSDLEDILDLRENVNERVRDERQRST